MVDWRELGEVPDSEDEDGIDSQNTEPVVALECQIEETSSKEGEGTARDIWDIPSSQETSAPVLPQALRRRSSPEAEDAPPQSPEAQTAFDSLTLSSPLSSPQSSQELPSLIDLAAEPNAVRFASAEAPSDATESHDAEEQDLEKHVQIPSSGPISTNYDDGESSLPRPRNSPTRTPLPSQILGHDVEYSSARQVAVQYERSLRARRPEQMRPYFTEEARYMNSWRQSGLRPLRFANTEEVTRENEDVGERDFEPPSEDSFPQQQADESQGLESAGGMDGVLFGALSSSPMETSPLNNRGRPSSQTGSQGDTDNTSLDGDDLPSLHDLAQNRSTGTAKPSMKRKLPPPQPAIRLQKRMRRQFGLEENKPSANEPKRFIRPPDSSDPFAFPDESDEPPTAVTPAARRNIQGPSADTETTTSERHPGVRPAEFTVESDSDEGIVDGTSRVRNHLGAQSDTESSSGSDSESEVANQHVRRIRGVLPASWLRLDQQLGRDKIQKKVHGRPRLPSPQKEPRRGVALPRVTQRSTPLDNIFSDESEDDAIPVPQAADDGLHSQTRLVLEPARTQQITEISDDDDAGSAMEDNQIDHMVSGRKRQTSLSNAFQKTTKRSKTTSAASRTPSSKTPRQPKITGSFGNSSTSATTKRREPAQKQAVKPRNRVSTKKGGRSGRTPALQRPPPQLSILDVIEPDAPQFLKIAARTAKASHNQGRASPTRKTIQLANRQDHIDAASVLDEWKKGSIKQRLSVTSSRKAAPRKERTAPLTDRTANAPRPSIQGTSVPRGGSRKLTKHVSVGGRVSYQAQREAEHVPAPRPAAEREQDLLRSARPAQLELDNSESMNAASFHAAKKLLDRVYRAKRAKSNATGSMRSHTIAGTITPSIPAQSLPRTKGDKATISAPNYSWKARRRKSQKPQRIDVDEPQYSHAHDPLPIVPSSVTNVEPTTSDVSAAKLQGLGPYGTSYTIHFEVFPLHSGVYFHHSTLIGSGQVATVLNEDLSLDSRGTRPAAKLVLGEKMMTWGSWNAQVSSEMGVVLDYVADHLENVDWSNSPSAAAAADHIFSYVKDSMTLAAEGDSKIFVSRVLELLESFNFRIALSLRNGQLDQNLRNVFQVLDRLLLVIFLSMKLIRSNPTMMGEQMQSESLLKSVATTLAQALLRIGLRNLRHVYKGLANIGLREKGLREDEPAIHSWVLLFRILESARIPRASFWDVVMAVVTPLDLGSSVRARGFEEAWESMFTLLPLIEFNDYGIAIPGSRHRAVTDGWSLAQKLLKRVFELYKANPRQSPSFNNYCRAIVGRCHYLVQQWGWRRCSGVVGIIFDFFGSQQLAHLRNEEAYGSPQFLEELSRTPSLDLQADDKCFHIFLKLVALSIHKLREDGLTKDIRNLITRTLPNHTRQLLKEQTIHEHDLAALRNHHDLLCTLFWAAPPDLRRSLNLISLLERLVVPASSHKEACLINLRAWSQLARFIIASGEATTSFTPFNQWRNTFFEQMIHQYDTVAADIEQQFQGLSKDVSQSVSRDMVKAMVSANKAAVMDVIHSCVLSSLDVIRCAGDLEAATFALNTLQLRHIFKHFFSDPPELDWAILRTCLSTLEVFLSRVDVFKDAEESQQSESQILYSAQADEALLALDHDLAGSYFSMARRILSRCSSTDLSTMGTLDKAGCVQQIVVLGARMGMRFINAGVTNIVTMFKPGKHGLFLDLPHKLGLEQRRYLPLFIVTLLKYGFDSFNDEDFTLLELWMLAIVKPRDYLMYENQLAEQLAHRRVDFVPQSIVGLAITPDYGTNRDLFKFAISSMRRSIRDAGPNLRKILLTDHQKTLRLVMDQLKEDLKAVSEDTSQHTTFVYFVRDIVSLIRAHGADICTVDDYFYQINKEYSPSVQDPQLQVAGMTSYGLRLAEGDSRVANQLFFFLFNNFKNALIGDKIEEEVAMLGKGIRNSSILNFVLGKMLPSIIRATAVEQTASPLLDVYAFALFNWLGDDVAPPELDEDNLGPLRLTLEAIIDGLKQLDKNELPSGEMLHLARQFVGLLNLFWPSLHVLPLCGASMGEWLEVRTLLGDIRAFMAAAMELNLDMTSFVRVEPNRESWVASQLCNSEAKATARDSHISSFTENIISDVRKNWIVTGDRLSIQAPGKLRNTQSTQTNEGIQRPRWGDRRDELLADFRERIREWNRWWDKVFGDGVPRHHADMSAVTLGF